MKVFEFAIDGDSDDLLGLEGNESDDEKDISGLVMKKTEEIDQSSTWLEPGAWSSTWVLSPKLMLKKV